MMSMTYHNLDFARTGLDLFACGCSSNASYDRSCVRNYAKVVARSSKRAFGSRKLVCHRRDIGRCRVFSTRTPEKVLNGNAQL